MFAKNQRKNPQTNWNHSQSTPFCFKLCKSHPSLLYRTDPTKTCSTLQVVPFITTHKKELGRSSSVSNNTPFAFHTFDIHLEQSGSSCRHDDKLLVWPIRFMFFKCCHRTEWSVQQVLKGQSLTIIVLLSNNMCDQTLLSVWMGVAWMTTWTTTSALNLCSCVLCFCIALMYSPVSLTRLTTPCVGT